MSSAVARPSTPSNIPRTPSALSTPVTGTWKHPDLDEIVRRQNASNFTDRNMRMLMFNFGGMITVWFFGRQLWNSLPNLLTEGKLLHPYSTWTYYLLQLLFLYNVASALLPLYRSPDEIQDIPLTPAQRKILGLPPSSTPATPDTKYVTPPRYARTPTPVSGSPNSRGSYPNSPLSGKGSPMSGSVSGSPFSPIPSPLLQKAMGGGMNGVRRHSYGSPSPLGPGASRINLPEAPGSPSPAAKAPSIQANLKSPPNVKCQAQRTTMGASDSKLVFKQGIFKLSQSQAIAADDPYWASFWELPESAEDVFSLFSPADIRRTRDTALENLETLVLAVTSRLFILRHHPSFPDPEFAPEKDALNCIRVLTRILPFVYEAEQLQGWEDKFFWGVRRKRTRKASLARDVLFDESQEELAKLEAAGEEFEEVKPLAEELIDTLIDLLFFADFTLPKPPNSKNKVSYAIWSSGVGCNTPIGTSKEFESNRTEILRLLLTLTSQSMYLSANMLPVQGVKAISYIVTCPDKQVVLSVLCSLLNTTLKYNPASWKIPYNVQVFKDPKLILVTYSLQFLLAVLLYSIPESDPAHTKKNYFRHFLGRLHRPQDFQFITEGITRVLNYPLHASTSYIPGNQQSNNKLTSEMIMFFWEMTQCNKRFRSFIIDTNRSHDFLVLIIYYALDYKLDASKQGIVRMCVFILQTLSVEPTFGKNLNKIFENQETLPPTIRLQNFNGSYADFLIHSIYNIITTSQGKLSAIYPALLAVINNVAAYLENLSASASSKLLQLFSLMSSPGFLLANDSNHDLLTSLLESMNAIIEHQYSKNPNFIYAVLRNKKRFEALRHFTLESGQQEIERRNRRRKEHANDPSDLSDSRRGSADSLRSPTLSHSRAPELSDVPEEGAFAIGDDEDEDDTDDDQSTPSPSTPTEEPSRASSISDSVDDAVPTQLRGMSEKARGKMPAGMPTFSRQNSTTSLSSYTTAFNSTTGAFEPSTPWIETWLPELPLHTLLTLISQLSTSLPSSATSSDTLSPSVLKALRTARIAGIEPSAIRIQYFEWSPLSLGWYESLLWSFVFLGEMQVQKGTVGVWNGSHIKLFRVEAVASMGPTLSSPRGAVDAVGSNIVSRIGSMNLRGSMEGGGASGGGSAGAGNGDRVGEREREREVRTGTGEPGVGTGLGGRSAVI
ncbi:Ubp5-interacting protein [Lachnellula occidentalis]|uniref:Ubp5-interacting protein n=1 Tax=Lachnellula occidentalis TaxID=215460 RepID=A0A8H8RSW9_9HELO|nr:Ubp5-interacting protein [Lachnellula occidentalis]